MLGTTSHMCTSTHKGRVAFLNKPRCSLKWYMLHTRKRAACILYVVEESAFACFSWGIKKQNASSSQPYPPYSLIMCLCPTCLKVKVNSFLPPGGIPQGSWNLEKGEISTFYLFMRMAYLFMPIYILNYVYFCSRQWKEILVLYVLSFKRRILKRK